MPDDNPVISELDLGEAPQEYLDFAKRELDEDPETRCQVLSDFRDLIYERGECDPHRTDDAFLLRFLRARQFVVRHAHKMLVCYYDFKENNPEVFDDVKLSLLRKVGDANLITVPPYREQTGRRILQYRFGAWNPQEFTITEVLQATLLILELAVLEPKAQIKGGRVLFDLEGLNVQHLWYMSPTLAKQIFDIMVTSFPLKVYAVHVVKQPWIFETIYNFFKPLMNEKMRERLFIHGNDMESLHEHINPKYLPERYGGIHPDYNYADWCEWFRNNDKIRWEMDSLGYILDEQKDDEESS